MAVLKVETDIIASISVSPIWWSVILVIMYIESLKLISIKRHNVMSHLNRYFQVSDVDTCTENITEW